MQAMPLRADWPHELEVTMKAKKAPRVTKEQSPLWIGDHTMMKVMFECATFVVTVVVMVMMPSSPGGTMMTHRSLMTGQRSRAADPVSALPVVA